MSRPDEPFEADVERPGAADGSAEVPGAEAAGGVPDVVLESGGGVEPVAGDDAARGDSVEPGREPDPVAESGRDPEVEDDSGAGSPAAAAGVEPASAWRRIGAALRPRMTRSQVLAGVLCAAVGFALAVQVRQSASDHLSSARQDELVRLLDDVTVRAERLDEEVARLEETRDELRSGSGRARAALELARERAESEGILSGRLPAEGPGVEITIEDPAGGVEASQLFNVLEELRNAGSEAVELNGVRLVTSSWFMDGAGGVVVDDVELSPPYRWTVIGDPATMDRALEIPGGALAAVRNMGAEATTSLEDRVEITAVRPPQEPQFADPQDAGQ